jgi:hypothetical protein
MQSEASQARYILLSLVRYRCLAGLLQRHKHLSSLAAVHLRALSLLPLCQTHIAPDICLDELLLTRASSLLTCLSLPAPVSFSGLDFPSSPIPDIDAARTRKFASLGELQDLVIEWHTSFHLCSFEHVLRVCQW